MEILKETDPVKENTGGMEGDKCNAFGEKDVVVQRFLGQFFEGEC